MARIRTIKPSLFMNERLAELPMAARFAYIGLFTIADREGRLEDRPKRIKAELLPYDSVNMNDLLERLQSAGFIIRYTASGGTSTESEFGEMKVIQVVNFTKHQRITGSEAETVSIYPPPNETRNSLETKGKDLGSDEETSGKHQGSTEDDRKGKERKGKEGNNSLAKNFENFSLDAIAFCEWFETLLPETRKITETDRRNWKQTYDDLIRLDKRDKQTIQRVVLWARSDPFWSTNFLSANKLRNKDKNGSLYFDVFLTKMTTNNGNTTSGTSQQSGRKVWDGKSHAEYEQLLDENANRLKAKYGVGGTTTQNASGADYRQGNRTLEDITNTTFLASNNSGTD